MKLRKTPFSTRRVSVLSLIGTLIAFPFVYFYTLDQIFLNATPRAAVIGFAPLKRTVPAFPDQQTEPHTCGVHALNAIYRAHGLVPEDHDLRFRLGTDRPAVPNQEDTLGTLQPDICRVLAQDAFHPTFLDVDDPDAHLRLRRHLERKWTALALIRKESTGGLHWIMLQMGPEKAVLRIDSQIQEPLVIDTERFFQSQAVSVFLVTPQSTATKSGIGRAHRIGVRAMRKSSKRIRSLASTIS